MNSVDTLRFVIINLLYCLLFAEVYSSRYPSVTQVTEPVQHGEGPVWDPRVGKLYYVDLHHGRVMAYDYAQGTTSIAIEIPGNDLVPVLLTEDPDTFIVGLNRSVAKVKANSKPELLHTVQNDHPKNRFNDGKADAKGRLWLGTMGYETPDGQVEPNVGALFRFSPEEVTRPSVEIANVGVGNGLAWNKDNTKFYYIDSLTQDIEQYDCDIESGHINNKSVVFSVKGKRMGSPDGMTIDVDDNLWVALYGGGSVIQINPKTGTLLRRIPIPAQYTTSLIWGGPNLDILYVTTSYRSLNEKEKVYQPSAGSVFAITGLGTKGRPENFTKF